MLKDLRRHIMMQAKSEFPYITEGLVLFIDRDLVEGGIIKDPISGRVFAGGSISQGGLIGIWEDGQYTGLEINSGCTYEIALFYNGNDKVIYCDTDIIQLYGNRIIVSAPVGAENGRQASINIGGKTISINRIRSMFNLIPQGVWDGRSYHGRYTSGIGIGNLTGNGTATIYSFRLYNRELSIDEMLHNQQIDNERFNLGL